MNMKHKVKEIFTMSYSSTLLVIEDSEQLPLSLLGEWQIWKDHILYKNINIIAENIPVPHLEKTKVLETKTILNRIDLDTEKHLIELSIVEYSLSNAKLNLAISI